jgi:LysR family hca operon transcriptional activator
MVQTAGKTDPKTASEPGESPAGDLDHRYLRYFIAVAEELSFTRAAERLNTVQPAVSQQIRRLEFIVGTPLFQRDKHHVQLTEAGRIFLEEARALLQHGTQAISLARRAARAEAGQITIGLLPGIEGRILSSIQPTLQTRYPDIQLLIRSLTSPQQLAALQQHEIDVAFMRGPIESDEIRSEVVLREPIVAVVPANHPFAAMERISLQTLSALPMIQVVRTSAPALHDVANQLARQAGVRFRVGLVTETVLATLNAVGSGLGFSLQPEYVKHIVPETVVAKPVDVDPIPQFELLMAYRKDNELPFLVSFLALLRSQAAAKIGTV